MQVRPGDKQPMLCWIMKDPDGQLIGETMSVSPKRSIIWARDQGLLNPHPASDTIAMAELVRQGYIIKAYTVTEL